jgi:tetratricopeptide (TPR) repeat protein
VCEAAARGEERAETTEARVACLDARRAGIARVLSQASGAGADPLDAWRAAELLPDASACTTLVASAAVPADKRAQAAAITAAIDELVLRHRMTSTPTLADATALRARAEALGYPPLVARALALEASFTLDAAGYANGEAIARHAIRVAEDAHDDVARAHAAAVLALALVDQGKVDEARGALDTADGALARGGGDPDVEDELTRARAAVTDAGGDPADGAAILRKRLDGLRARLGDDSILVAEAWLDLAPKYTHANDEARAADAMRAGEEILARHGGTVATPEALALAGMQALQAGDFARAIDQNERAYLAAREAKYPDRAIAVLALDRATSYEVAGRWREGLAAYVDAQQIFERIPAPLRDVDGTAQALLGVGSMRLELGDAAGAIAPLRAAVASDTALGAPAADDLSLAQSILGRALVATGAMHDARVLLEPTLRALRDATPQRPQRTGSVAFYLAQALWDDGDTHDRERAQALAGDAEHDLAQAIADATDKPVMSVSRRLFEDRLHAIEAWRARHR